MAKERILSLKQTKGYFNLKGVVQGVNSKDFYKEGITKNGDNYRSIRFGVKTDNDNIIYVELFGQENKLAYFYSKQDKLTERVNWADRNNFSKETYELIGKKIGLVKGEDGKNVKRNLVEYDAVKYISENLKDGQWVFVDGELEFSSFTKGEDIIRSKKFYINSLYSAKEENFDDEEHSPTNDFKHKIIYTGIEKDEEIYKMSAVIVGYKTIENVEFDIENKKLAANIKKRLKPYTALDAYGKIINKAITEEVEEVEDDGWGELDPFKKEKTIYDKKMLIIGLDKDTFDEETYAEDLVNKDLKALKSFGNDNFGTTKDFNEEEDGDDSFF